MTLLILILLLLLFLVAFYGVIRPWRRKRDEARMRPKAELEPLPAAPRPKILPPLPTLARSSNRRVDVAGANAAPPGVVRRQARSPVSTLLDARRGIVLVTLLGPCRALDHLTEFPNRD